MAACVESKKEAFYSNHLSFGTFPTWRRSASEVIGSSTVKGVVGSGRYKQNEENWNKQAGGTEPELDNLKGPMSEQSMQWTEWSRVQVNEMEQFKTSILYPSCLLEHFQYVSLSRWQNSFLKIGLKRSLFMLIIKVTIFVKKKSCFSFSSQIHKVESKNLSYLTLDSDCQSTCA